MENYLKKSWDFFKYYVVGLYYRIEENHLFLLSGGLAFSIFVCTIPLTLIFFSILGYVLDEPEAIRKIGILVDKAIPYTEYANSVKEIIAERVESLTGVRRLIGLVGIVGVLFTTTSLFSSIRTALNKSFRIKESESVLHGKLWDFVLVFLVLFFLSISVILLPLINAVSELSGHISWLDESTVKVLDFILVQIFSYIMFFLAFLLVYWMVPVKKTHIRIVICSALTATILWMTAKELFGYYISQFATLKHLYGAYAFIIIVAFWIYYSALVFILSAEIGQLYGERYFEKKRKSINFFNDVT